MAQLVVRNLPDEVKARLKRRAKLRGHSLEAEVRQLLSDAPELPEIPPHAWVESLKAKAAAVGITWDDVEALREEIDRDRRSQVDRKLDL